MSSSQNLNSQPLGRRKEAAAVNPHVLYYAREQEKKRDEILKKRERIRLELERDYDFVKIEKKHFSIYKKKNPSEEQIEVGKEYRIKFTIVNTQCFFDCKEDDIQQKIDEVYLRLTNKSS